MRNTSKCYYCGSLQLAAEIFEGTLCIDCFRSSAVGCYFSDGDFICLTDAASQFAVECGHESELYSPSALRSIWKYVAPVVDADDAGKSIMPHVLTAKENLQRKDFHYFLHQHHVSYGPDGTCRIKEITTDFPELRHWNYTPNREGDAS